MKKLFKKLRDKKTHLRPQTLTSQLMLPLAISVLISSIGIMVTLYQLHRHNLHDMFTDNVDAINTNMEVLLNEQATSLSLSLNLVASDPSVQKALREKNTTALLQQWQDVFKTMKEKNNLSHFYFLDKNRVCLLRVHNPSKKGDVIERFTAREAEWRRSTSSGLEVGTMGQLTLRCVQPVIVDNEVIGYVEMGKEIEDILHMLHVQSDIDLIMVLHKDGLNQKQWGEGMQMFNREAHWNMLPSDVLIYSSFEKLPFPFVDYLKKKLTTEHTHHNLDEDINANDNTYRIANIEVKDVSGKEVGDLFIIENITEDNLDFFDIWAVVAIIGTLFITSTLTFIYLLLKRTDDEITNQQKNLVESQQRLEELALHSKTIAWEVDNEGKYTYVSEVIDEVLGYSVNEVIGKYFYELYPVAGREEFKTAAFAVFKRKESFSNFRNKALHKNGHIVWLMTNGLPIIAPDGHLLGYRGNDTDITEWKKAEDGILESRNLLHTIIDTIPIRVFWKNKHLRYMGCNTLFANDAGLSSSSELIGKDDYQLSWRDQATMYREDDRAVIESAQEKLFYEEEQTTPDGGKIWLSTSKIPLRNTEGEIIGILGIYEDITRQKELQEKLRLNADMLNEAQHFAHMGSWSLDLRNNTLVWSAEVYRILEQDPDHFIPTYESFSELIHPEDRDIVNNAYMTSLSSQQPYDVIHRVVMSDGRIKWVHESGISDFDEQGKPLRSIGTVQDITERKSAEEEINRLAYYDVLTQLPNKILFIDRLKQAQVICEQNQHYGALLFIDLDHFKTLNDTLGHGMGDVLLKQSAKRLMECVREGDSVARLGGDEFVILLTHAGDDEKRAGMLCKQIGKKILSELNKPYSLEGISYQSTASIGITLFNNDTVSDDELMKQADLAMYRSKDMGRNTLSFFDPKMESALKARSRLEEEIREAIEEKQFALHYQPQVDTNGIVNGAEALVRWNHPKRGIISPAEFIPLSEETGLIVPLGEWILDSACQQIQLWSNDKTFDDITVSVNVSPKQFNQHNFVDVIISTVNRYGINPNRLKIELTESLLVQNIQKVIDTMNRLKAFGISFSLDDYGTGYSSLSYLKQLPLDQLKIDQGFVRDILSDSNDAVICKSTIALAYSMNLSVIAEGVETEEQIAVLRSFGCGAFQGYYYSRPLNAEAFTSYLKISQDKR